MLQDLRPYLRTIALLVAAQGLASSGMTMLVTVSGLVGLALAPQEWMATLPNSAVVVGTLLSILPWSWAIQARGWRPGLLGGLTLGLLASLLAAGALLIQSFALYTLACLLMGSMAASVTFYVYAGTEMVPTPSLRRHVIAAITTAGLISAFVGPSLVRNSAILYKAVPFVGGFIGLVGVLLAAALAVAALPLPGRNHGVPADGLGFSEWPLVKTGPIYGMLVSAAAYAMMVLLMVGAPIAIKHAGHHAAVAAGAIQWHLIGMFAPALLLGAVINRIGVRLAALCGVLLALVAIWLGQSARTGSEFALVLFLCGVGWSFMFTAGTTLVVEKCPPENRVRVQGLVNLVISGTNVISSFAAGPLLAALGYPGLALAALLPLTVAVIALAAGRRREQMTALAEAAGNQAAM